MRRVPRAVQSGQSAGATAASDELGKFGATLDFIRERRTPDYRITAPQGIDEAKYLKVGGIEQWVTIRGEDRANPVVLVLHGGPGDATNPWGHAGFRAWLKTYTVVQWDQRGSGRTLGRNGRDSAATLTIDRLVQDGVELADALRTSLRKDKIILVGHSWGSVLGVLMAKAKPELFQAFVGTGQVGDPARGYHVAFDALLAKARAVGDARALRELEEAGPPPYKDGRGYQVQRRWSNLFEGADAFIASMLGFALSAPGYTMGDVNDWLDGQGLSAERLVPAIECPHGGRIDRPIRRTGVRHPGCRRFHHAHQPRQGLRRWRRRATEGLRDHRGRALRRVHELDRVPEGARRAARRHAAVAARADRSDGLGGDGRAGLQRAPADGEERRAGERGTATPAIRNASR